jgi:transcriptional regulator with GAF, ATPase, and Fis domain
MRKPSLARCSARAPQCFSILEQAARSDVSVLLRGETGVGKDLVARSVHAASTRKDSPFVVIDCASLPASLLESELFGHARGAFTGALSAHEGAFEAAAGGTIFIDEIGELPLGLQPKLLRVLEARAVRRLGESNYRPIDVRIIAATHRDLRAMVNAGTFREDLYFRLAVLPLHIPAIRERAEDIPMLLLHFLGNATGRGIPSESMASLIQYTWPGNVRELRNFAQRVDAVGLEHALRLMHGEASYSDIPSALSAKVPDVSAVEPGGFETLDACREKAERAYLERLVAAYGSNMTKAAKVAGVARAHLYRLFKKANM